MEKVEYLYMVIDEIENAKKLREESINKKEFYNKINGDKEIIRDLDNNIELANKTVDSLHGLIYLPVYEIIQKMSNNDLLNYKKQLLSKIDGNIFKEFNIIEGLKEECKELITNIDDIISNYLRYKKDNVLDDEQLYSYVYECKEMLNRIEEINNNIKKHENIIANLKDKRNIIETKTIENIKKYLINSCDLNNIDYELEKYKVSRADEIIVNLCNDLKVLDEVESLIKDYIILKDKSVQKIVEVPKSFEEYKSKNVTNIRDFILTKCNTTNYHKRTNEVVIFDEKETNIIKNNIDKVIKEITDDKRRLVEYKLKVNEFAKLAFNFINKDLIVFISNLCDTLYLTELEKNSVNELYSKYMKLVNKKNKTEYSVNKSIRIEKELMYVIRDILDIYWEVLCDELESIITNIKNDAEFVNIVSSYDIHKGKNKELFDTKNFSEIGLLNMRLLIENILGKYSEISNELKSFSNDLSYYKDNMIQDKNNNEKELRNIKNKIDELYFKVSPNDFPILVSDYDKLNKIFKEKTLIDSIVKINRKNLISKVRSESTNYRDKENIISQDIEVIKKKVLNQQ